jgi:hypothetical protein
MYVCILMYVLHSRTCLEFAKLLCVCVYLCACTSEYVLVSVYYCSVFRLFAHRASYLCIH